MFIVSMPEWTSRQLLREPVLLVQEQDHRRVDEVGAVAHLEGKASHVSEVRAQGCQIFLGMYNIPKRGNIYQRTTTKYTQGP
jgi:hypothetical protein